jgi:hypothetical protein
VSKMVALNVNGQQRQIEVDYLKPAALEYWQAWIQHEARLAYNPFAELAEKIDALDPELRVPVAQQFVAGLNFDSVPKIVLLDTLQSLPAMQMLCTLMTGKVDLITEENYLQAFPQLIPFIQRVEYVADSIADANRIRASLGKPPLGAGKHVKPNGSPTAPSEPDKATTQQGG